MVNETEKLNELVHWVLFKNIHLDTLLVSSVNLNP